MGIEWFDWDNHLTWEVEKALDNNWKIDSDEAKFMSDIIDKYWRWNIKIKKEQLKALWKEFWYNYFRLSKIWPSLEKRIKERANTIWKTKNNISVLKKNIWNSNEKLKASTYLSSNWKLKNVNPINLMTLISKNIDKVNDLIWNKNNFSITNKYWKTYNVFLWKLRNWKIDYFYKDWPKKNQKVKIFNWDKLWKYNVEWPESKKVVEITKKTNDKPKNNIEKKWRWIKELLNFISKSEWTENHWYNVRFGYRKTPNLSKMTINQVMNFQKRIKWHTAIWKYQIKDTTLEILSKKFPKNTKMTPDIQDKMAIKLLEGRWLNSYKKWRISTNRFINRLAHEWASLPMTNWRSAYHWDKAWNKSKVSVSKFRSIVKWLKYS